MVNKEKVVFQLLKKSSTASHSAKFLFSLGDYDAAANRAYYSLFKGVNAILLDHDYIGFGKIKTHSGLINLFNEHLVKTGIIDKAVGKNLATAFDMRTKADYLSEEMLDKDEVELLLLRMDSLLEALLALKKSS